MNEEFKSRFMQYKQSLAAQKVPVQQQIPESVNIQLEYVPPSTRSELAESFNSLKEQARPIILAAKLIIIGMMIVFNVISYTIYTTWTEFMASPEYQQFIYRTGRQK